MNRETLIAQGPVECRVMPQRLTGERVEAKHTPGPWNAKHREGSDGMYRTEIFSSQYGGIATCEWTKKNCGNGVTATYREANANLIAHAPDLLRSLIDCEARLALLVASGRAKMLDAVAAEHARAVIAAALGHNACYPTSDR